MPLCIRRTELRNQRSDSAKPLLRSWRKRTLTCKSTEREKGCQLFPILSVEGAGAGALQASLIPPGLVEPAQNVGDGSTMSVDVS